MISESEPGDFLVALLATRASLRSQTASLLKSLKTIWDSAGKESQEVILLHGNHENFLTIGSGMEIVFKPKRLQAEFNAATDPVPTTADGGLDWIQVSAVRILGVLDTHERKNRKPV